MNRSGSMPRSPRRRFVNRTFSPVFADLFSTRMLAAGTPIETAILANFSASGSFQNRRVIPPSPPEKSTVARTLRETAVRPVPRPPCHGCTTPARRRRSRVRAPIGDIARSCRPTPGCARPYALRLHAHPQSPCYFPHSARVSTKTGTSMCSTSSSKRRCSSFLNFSWSG